MLARTGSSGRAPSRLMARISAQVSGATSASESSRGSGAGGDTAGTGAAGAVPEGVAARARRATRLDRETGVSGTRVAGRVDLGRGALFKKKTGIKQEYR